jgi:HD-like signal output (HDOD) protein
MGTNRLLRLNELVDEVSTLPAVAAQVISRASDPEIELSELAEIIEKDTALTLRFLALANSAAMARGHEVTELRPALVRLGLDRVRTISLCVTLHDVFPSRPAVSDPDFDRVAFWKNILGVATSAQILAQHTAKGAEQESYLAGILHDVGKSVLDQKEHVQFTRAVRLARDKQIPLPAAEEMTFGFNHAELGARILSEWNLPELLVQVVRYHLEPGREQGVLPEARRVIGLLNDAVQICRSIHLGDDGESDLPLTFNQLLQTLRINSRQLEQLVVKVQSEVEQTANLLELEVTEPAQYLRALQVANRELSRIGLEGLMQELMQCPEGEVFVP